MGSNADKVERQADCGQCGDRSLLHSSYYIPLDLPTLHCREISTEINVYPRPRVERKEPTGSQMTIV